MADSSVFVRLSQRKATMDESRNAAGHRVQHGETLPCERYELLAPEARRRYVAALEQRVDALQAEVQRLGRAERSAGRARCLHQITAALSRVSTFAEVCQVVVHQGVASLGSATGGLWLLRDSGDGADSVAELVESANYSSRADSFRHISLNDTASRTPIGDLLRRRAPVWICCRQELIAQYPAVAEEREPQPEMAIAALPLTVEGRGIGALAFTFDTQRAFEEEERQFMLVLADHCAQAMERARLFDLQDDARRNAEAARARNFFLAEATLVLSSSLDVQETLRRLASVAVPHIADWCSIEMAWKPGQPTEQVAVAHVDPNKVAHAKEFRRRWPPDPDAPDGVHRVMETGRSQLISVITDAVLQHNTHDSDKLAALRKLGLCSAMIVPIAARGRVFGAITLVSAEKGVHYDQVDLEVAEHLGRRAGIAVDNALLHQAANAATRARDDVLAVVSHDLRNPLNVIALSAASLLQLDVPETVEQHVRHAAELIERSSVRMARLIDDLGDFASIQAGSLAISHASCAAADIVMTVTEMFAAQAQHENVSLKMHSSGNTQLCCDRDRVVQALGNIVSNAVKITPAGGSVRVGVTQHGPSVEFFVEDTGPGLTADETLRIFDRYWRGARADYKGRGLGLAISKGIVEAHRGRIWVESQPGRGSRFAFRIPTDFDTAK